MTRLMLTKDLLIAPRANASLGATRAAFGAFPDHDVAPGLRWTRVSRGRWDWAVFVVGLGVSWWWVVGPGGGCERNDDCHSEMRGSGPQDSVRS